MLVFLDRHQLAGALAFLEQPGFLFRSAVAGLHVAARVRLGGVDLIIPAAGVGAGALVRIAPVEVAGEQAAAGIRDAQRAMHEDFEFDVRAFLTDFGDFVE